ncbi:MAG: hypothetical protein ABEJ40_04880 [Haloarculaceae archaeon]
MRWRVSAVLGVALAVVGLAAVAVPSLATGIPADDTVVFAVGLLLVLGGLRQVQRRRSTTFDYAEAPDVERVVELPTPGDELDRRFEQFSALQYRKSDRERVRSSVADLAAETLQRRFGYSESEAEEALRRGTWTDDPFAASFFSRQPPDVGAVGQAREILQNRSAYAHRAHAAASELHRIAVGDGRRDDGSERGGTTDD